jgi:hypothetical protein
VVPLKAGPGVARRARVSPARLAIALIASTAAVLPADAAVFGVDLYGASYHFDRRDVSGARFNEANFGAGLDAVLVRGRHHTVFADLSVYRDSFRQPNVYGSIAWTHELLGPLEGGVTLAVSGSPAVNGGEPFMAPIPTLSWRTDRAALHLLYLPSASQINAYESLAAYATLYPFAPARAATGAPDPEETRGRRMGIEFALGPSFTLRGLGDASVAVRGARGPRSWRVAADVDGLLRRDARTRDGVSDPSPRDYDRFLLTLRAERFRHTPAPWGASLMLGGGPLLGYTNRHPRYDDRQWRLGVTGTLAVAWPLGRAITLAAEQGADLAFTRGRGETLDGSVVRIRTEKRVGLDARQARISVTAWFR